MRAEPHSEGCRRSSASSACGAASAANGAGGRPAPFLEQHRSEVVRLILQALNSLGYAGSAAALEEESGVLLQSAAITAFRSGILSGDWDKACELLPKLALDDEQAERNVTYHVRRQKYLELLEDGDSRGALTVLREEVAPVSEDPAALHALTALLACRSKDTLHRRACWGGRKSRSELLVTLHRFISSKLLLHEDRLCTLLQQAQLHQRERCVFLNRPMCHHTLLQDVACDETDLPCNTQVVLADHQDEVWYVTFSPDGRWLATGGRDGRCIVYDVAEFQCSETASREIGVQTFSVHTNSIHCMAFSPDSRRLLTGSEDTTVVLLSVCGGSEGQAVFVHHSDPVTGCCWLPSGRQFLSASADRSVVRCDLEGAVLQRWTGPRVFDLCVTPNEQHLICIDSEKQIVVYDLRHREDFHLRSGTVTTSDPNSGYESDRPARDRSGGAVVYILRERDNLTSVSLSTCGRYLLCGVSVRESRGCIHLYDLHQRRVIQRYRGYRQSKYVIKSVFGGESEGFVAGGSEDGTVVIFHRRTGQKLSTLAGHRKVVNSVAWSPVNPRVLASCSDDHSVRVWTTAPAPEH